MWGDSRTGMRRIALAGALALLAAGLLAAPAQATFHLQKVNEVQVASSAGSTDQQFVEMFDQGGPTETFPITEGPYRLAVYDAAGTKLFEQTLDATALSNARSAGVPFLIGSDAYSATRDAALAQPLPTSAGQACYNATSSDTPYSCITWGCLTHVVSASAGTGTAQGGVPPNGQSVQRQSDDSLLFAAPTPKAANATTGTPTGRCSSSPTGGGGTTGGGGATGGGGGGTAGGGGGATFSGASLPARTAIVRHGRARVRVACSTACSGRLVLSAHGVGLGAARFHLATAGRRTVSVRLTRAGRRLLAHRRRLRVRARTTARTASGPSRTRTAKLVLLRR